MLPPASRSRAAAIALAAALAIAGAGHAPAGAAQTGDIVPLFKTADILGRALSLGELTARKRLAVFFWDWRRATSTRAMQALDRLQESLGPRGFEVVAVEGEGSAQDQVVERVEKMRAIGIRQRYTIVADPGGRIARQFRVASTPQIFLLDGAGRVFAHFDGFRAEDEELLTGRVGELLGISAPPPPKAVRAEPPPPPAQAAPEVARREPPGPEEQKRALLERYSYFGNYHLNRGEPAKAEEFFRKQAELAPGDVTAWLRIGEACARQGRYDQAREAWETVQRIEPRNPEADANIRRLIRGEY